MGLDKRQGIPGSESAVRAIELITDRLSTRLETLATTLADRYRSEIVDYSAVDQDVLHGDVIRTSMQNVQALLKAVRTGDGIGSDDLEDFREAGARRVHQGVRLESLLHACRLWGETVWHALLDCARIDETNEREAALLIASRVIEHMNILSTVVAQGYHEEAEGVWSDREVIRRDLLEAVISGKGRSASVRGEAASLQLQLSDDYVVILARRSNAGPEQENAPSLRPRAEMRRVIDSMKRFLQPAIGSLLFGLRQDEVVALYPLEPPGNLDEVSRQCAELAGTIGAEGFELGVGGWHPGPEGVQTSYAEAREALEIAGRSGIRGRPVIFEDLLLDHVLRTNPKSEQFLTETIRPVVEYDTRKRSDLVQTFEAYMDAGFNITKSASQLLVHPNTVVYRLRRIQELTGRDPHVASDLIILCLALNLIDEVASSPKDSGGLLGL
ncbi:MAG: PucR family transcriptional regulator [Actinomycetota bacterium]